MMEDVGVVDDPRRAGYYSGVMVGVSVTLIHTLISDGALALQESAFAIAELLTVMKWGSLSGEHR